VVAIETNSRVAPHEAVAMAFLFSAEYHKVGKNGVSPFQNMCAYLGGSAIQTVGDNPVTAYRQLVQQYAKDLQGNTVAPKVAVSEANATFLKNPVGASLSGLWPRLIGVLLKRIPKFGFLLGYSFVVGEGDPGFAAATCASICSAPFINPVRLVEKQQRAFFKTTGTEKPILEILGEAKAKNFAPLFRGTIPLMGHSLASAILGLVGQPKLQKYVQKELGSTGAISGSATNLVASAAVWNSNIQPDFNVSVCDSFDAISSAVLRELDESNRFVQKSAESTSI